MFDEQESCHELTDQFVGKYGFSLYGLGSSKKQSE
jgi:hypothetical protein